MLSKYDAAINVSVLFHSFLARAFFLFVTIDIERSRLPRLHTSSVANLLNDF